MELEVLDNGDCDDSKQTLCVRWIHHNANLLSYLDGIIETDCTFYLDQEHHFMAHRVVLAASSAYFHSMLQDMPASEHCAILLPGVQPDEMLALITYMYTGMMFVPKRKADHIMHIAEQLELRGVFDLKKSDVPAEQLALRGVFDLKKCDVPADHQRHPNLRPVSALPPMLLDVSPTNKRVRFGPLRAAVPVAAGGRPAQPHQPVAGPSGIVPKRSLPILRTLLTQSTRAMPATDAATSDLRPLGNCRCRCMCACDCLICVSSGHSRMASMPKNDDAAAS